MTFLFYTFLTLLIAVSVILILLILIQKGRGGGLSSAFGGGGGSTAFGTKTGDVLTWATSIIFGVFIILAVVLNLVVMHQYGSTTSPTVQQSPATPSSPVVPPGVPGM
jgi:preprotein translocase subunit SecG